MLWRFGERSIYRRGERMHEIRVARRVEPQETPAELAERPLRLAGRHLTRSVTVIELRVVDGEVLLTFDLQRARVGAEVDSVSATTGRLAADGAVARLIRVRCRGFDSESHSPSVTRTVEQHIRLPPAASGPRNLSFRQRDVDVIALDLDLVFGDGLYGREGECLACNHVELCAVARTLYLVADQLSLVQGTGVVGAYVLDGVELTVHVAESNPVTLQLVDANLTGGHVSGLGYLVELSHVRYATRSSKPSPIL